jgi:quinol-cytochrome oxidoreductase complex cytochrome b subunit
MVRRLLDWLEDRTGIGTIRRHPVGPRCLGRGAVVALQAATGILLALNMRPRRMRRRCAHHDARPRTRSPHDWGASLMVVVVVLRVPTFVGGYVPREATWIGGVVLRC